jgi:hypothetical protein
MSENALNTFTLAVALAVPIAAWPAADVKPLNAKPGLWESSVSTETAGRPAMAGMPQIPPEALAKMPPQQRAQLEAMMKSRSGGRPITTKVCLTRESLSSGVYAHRDKSCTTRVISSSSTTQVLHVDCNRDELKSSGDVTVELLDPQHIRGTMVMKSSASGQTTEMKMSFDNKWIADDCGAIKPAVPK